MVASRRQVELLEKNKPRQERAKRTYEAILAAAAELLVEVGVERISTNIIAERAGITVPALYRYFPNKYSVLHALGAALMDVQNEVFQSWLETHPTLTGPEELMENVEELLQKTYDVTRAQTGGLEILQSLRAVGPLQELRLESHRLVAEQLATIIAEIQSIPVDEDVFIKARTSVDAGYAIVEMALEDNSLSPEKALREGAAIMQVYWRSVLLGN